MADGEAEVTILSFAVVFNYNSTERLLLSVNGSLQRLYTT